MIDRYKIGLEGTDITGYFTVPRKNVDGDWVKYEDCNKLVEITENFYSLINLLVKSTIGFISALEAQDPLFGPDLSEIYDRLVALLDKFEKLKVKD